MRDNAFDKGVQDKMDEFRLTPSAPVWPEVERRIRERKKRRILIFWFCLAGLLLTGAGAWWLLNEKSVTPSIPVAGKNSGNAQTENNRNEATTIKTGQSDSPVVTGPTSTPSRNQSNTAVIAESTSTTATKNNSIAKTKTKTKTVPNTTQSNLQRTVNPVPVKKSTTLSVAEDQDNIQITAINGKKAKRAATVKNKPSVADSKPAPQAPTPVSGSDPILNPTVVNNDPQTDVVSAPIPVVVNDQPVKKTDTMLQAKPDEPKPASPVSRPKKGPRKWQIGLLFAFGEAKLTESRLSLFSEKRFDALQSGMSSGNGNFSTSSFADSLPLKGTAFHAGVYAKRKAGKKTSFSAGLNLAFYSGKQRVGAFVDSVRQLNSPYNTRTTGGFYRSGSGDWYTNKYYYLQLPLLLHWQLNKGSKLPPLEWENGFVPSLMLGSRALVYDRGSTIFFRDRSVYTRFSLVYQTGFTATFASRTRHPLSAGLYYNYHFSKLQGVNPPDFNHQSSYGIQFRWILRK